MKQHIFYKFIYSSLLLAILGCGGSGGGNITPDKEEPENDDPIVDDGGPYLTPGNTPPTAPSGIGYSIAGNSILLYWGDIVTPEGIIENGQMLIDSTGVILYVGQDASGQSGYEGATKLICSDGIATPGLIDMNQHSTYNEPPYSAQSDEKYEHSNDWRRGLREHTKIKIQGGGVPLTAIEPRSIIGGVTSGVMSASSSVKGFTRNLETGDTELGLGAGDRETFPLGTSSGIMQTLDPNAYSEYPQNSVINSLSLSSVFDIAEGIDKVARTEFLAISGEARGQDNILGPKLVIAGALALTSADYKKIADSGASIVWTPRHDISIYGDTARVTVFKKFGGNISLGSYWRLTGSVNLLHELKAADAFNTKNLCGFFKLKELFEMATINGAKAMGVQSKIGCLKAGMLADFVVFRKNGKRGYAVPVRSQPSDVQAVFRSGTILYGDSYLIENLTEADTGYETLSATDIEKRIYSTREIESSVTSLLSTYPLNISEKFDDIRTAIPSRSSGSSIYTGIPTANDKDGDGIPNDEDNAPNIFNPIRPVDNGVQQVMN